MSHRQQMEFVETVRRKFPDFFHDKHVLEIGSLDINGSVRSLFTDCRYVGLDLGEGPGVDVICQAQDYNAEDNSFDVVISCEVMEHNPFWVETFENMIRVCRPGGLIVMTCASAGRAEHGTTRSTKSDAPLIPWDYYKNLIGTNFSNAIDFRKKFSAYKFMENFDFCDLYFAGVKMGAQSPANASTILSELSRSYFLRNMKNISGLKRRILVKLVGDERYHEGPVKFRDLIPIRQK